MRFPTIHNNGTGFETLRDGYFNAYMSVHDAIEKVTQITCHGRDYYVQEGDGASEAYAEHAERVRSLYNIKMELEKIVVDLDEQQLKRNK
jgi:glutamine synthetase type III